VDNPPLTEAEMRGQLDQWYTQGVLRADDRVKETVQFIRNAPLHPLLKPGYRILFAAAVYSLEPRYRQMLGLSVPRLGPFPLPVRLGTKVVLGVVHLALGGLRRRMGPSELAARQRLRRLGEPLADMA
jgi:uncharacterized protein (DUF2236 family)